MADALVERRPTARFFCHRCNIEFEDVLQVKINSFGYFAIKRNSCWVYYTLVRNIFRPWNCKVHVM